MASTSQWTPAPGRHKVNIGSSLGRALKARKNGGPPQKRNNLPDRDFYSLRYNFKPSSIDSSKSGSIQVKRNKDATHSSIIVEHPVSQTNDVHVYKGREEPAKEWACVLIFDEETGGYTLEKIESFVALEHVEKRAASVSEPSPAPTPPTNRPTTPEQENDDLAEMLLNELASPQPTPKTNNSNPDSEEDIPLTSRVPPRPPQHPPKAPVRSRPQPVPASKPAAAAPAQPNKKGRRPEPPASEETRNPPSKRSRPSPPPQPQPPAPARTKRPPPKKPSPPPPRQPAALELPGTSSSFIPPAPPSHNVPSPQPPPPEPEPPSTLASDSEDDDMVEVSAQPEAEAGAEPVPDQLSHRIVMFEETGDEHYNDNENEGDEEIDIGELETLMAQHLGEDGQEDGQDYGQDYGQDFGQEDADDALFPDSPAPELDIPIPAPIPGVGGPISLNQFAGGGEEYDDYSSSDESDEDDD